MTIRDTLLLIRSRRSLCGPAEYAHTVERAITVLEHENPAVRPPDSSGLSGGVVRLRPDIPTLILPDLHARVDFFMDTMDEVLIGSRSVLESLAAGELQVLCLGDGFHSERRGYERWMSAFREYTHGWARHKAMDEEMTECFSLMEMVMECKCAFRDNFHFLKGNHENILNEEGNGNHPFRKFSLEGEMVKTYVLDFFGPDFLETYALFEKSLPLFAVGGTFLASHAEPSRFFAESELTETRTRGDVILGLTWTGNDEADGGSVERMLDRFLPDSAGAVYFGGHRPVSGYYETRAQGKYVQIHNPSLQIAALVVPDRPFDPGTDMRIITGTKEALAKL